MPVLNSTPPNQTSRESKPQTCPSPAQVAVPAPLRRPKTMKGPGRKTFPTPTQRPSAPVDTPANAPCAPAANVDTGAPSRRAVRHAARAAAHSSKNQGNCTGAAYLVVSTGHRQSDYKANTEEHLHTASWPNTAASNAARTRSPATSDSPYMPPAANTRDATADQSN